MNKKIILPISLMLLVGLVGVVLAYDYSSVEADAPIFKGWNLVYGLGEPSQLDDWVTSDKVDIKAVYAFIPTTQEYLQVYPKPNYDLTMKMSEFGYDDEELVISALWVYSDKQTGRDFNGRMNAVEYNTNNPLSLADYSLIPIYKGWNFIGITPEMIGKKLSNIKGTCNIEKAHFWNPEEQKWEVFPLNEDFGNEGLMMGMVIKVTNDCKFGTSGGSVPPVPNLP